MHPLFRLFGIFIVFLFAGLCWLTLGGVTRSRTNDQTMGLEGQVSDLWGSAQIQSAPTFTAQWAQTRIEEEAVTDARTGSTQTVRREVREMADRAVQPASSALVVDLSLDQRRKGLVWYPLYDVDFQGDWTYVHHGLGESLLIRFPFPDASGVYDGFSLIVNGVDRAEDLRPENGALTVWMPIAEGDRVTVRAAYRSRGMREWTYRPTPSVGQIDDFTLSLTTDFADIDFPTQTLSPSTREQTAEGWALSWRFDRLVSGYGMGMVMPEMTQPGALAADLSFSAPLSLGLFFLWIFVLGMLRGQSIHPMNYLFIAAAFFAFDLLFAYTADRLPVEYAFALASVISLGLVTSYLRLVVGPRFALVEAGLAQLLYQIGFALAHFWDGATGLTITILGIVTLFALMQLTGRLRWESALAPAKT